MTKEYIATLQLLRVFQSALLQDQIPGQKPSLKFSKFTFHYPSKSIVTTPEVDLTKITLSILCEQILAKIYSSLRRFDFGKNFLQPQNHSFSIALKKYIKSYCGKATSKTV